MELRLVSTRISKWWFKSLTEVDGPCRVPTFDVLPLEQACQEFALTWHPGASDLDFLLAENPGHRKYHVRYKTFCSGLGNIPIGFRSRRQLWHRERCPNSTWQGYAAANSTLSSTMLNPLSMISTSLTCTSSATRRVR